MKRFITVVVLAASLFGLTQFGNDFISVVARAESVDRLTDVVSSVHMTHVTSTAALTGQSLEGTIAALEGGASHIPLVVATALIEGWITQLSMLEDPALAPVIEDLNSLLTALDERNVDAATAAMMSLSEETASLAEAVDEVVDKDMLRQLGELLANAGQEAITQETNEQETVDETQSIDEDSADVTQEEASEGEQALDGGQSTAGQTLEGTIAVLQGGATNIPLVVVTAIVDGWITQLSALEDPALVATVADLDSLLTALDERDVDAATTAVVSLRKETASLAEALDNDMLRQLAAILADAVSD
ncbi:MAG: hypothetical protein AAF267_14635 [Deinococcota bacterium]